MPRNRSEKLHICPEAIAYADAAEVWLRAESPGRLELRYWKNIPQEDKFKITQGSKGTGALRSGRQRRVQYIREAYAP